MNKTRYSKTGLMLVEDPRETLETMCTFKNSIITWDLFKTKYEDITGRKHKPVDKGTVDTHFYTLTIFDLLTPCNTKGQYTLSITGRDLCDLLNSEKKTKFQMLLTSVLLGNEHKGDLFKEFLQYVEKPRDKTEVYVKFKNIPGRTLIAWCQLANLIEVQVNVVWRINKNMTTKITMDKFYNVFITTYNEMQKTGMIGIRRIFMNVDDLRKNVCYRLGGISIDEFDKYLTKLLNSKDGKKIRFYGAPSSVFEERRNFNYHGRWYAYISIGE